MVRLITAVALMMSFAAVAPAQSISFGSRTSGLGNAGGFATGGGMSNSTQTSAGFGMNVIGPFSGAGFSNGGNAGINLRSSAVGGYYAPASNFAGNVYSNVGSMAGTTYDSSMAVGAMSAANGLDSASTFGWNNLPYNTSMYGLDPVTGLGIGNAVGYPGLGYPGVGYPGLGYAGGVIPGVTPGVGLNAFGVPTLGVPGLGVPGLGVPGLGVPGLGVPGLGVPGLGLGVPGVGVSGLGVPYLIPGVNVGVGNDLVSTTPPKIQARAGATVSESLLPGKRSSAVADSTTAIKLQNRLTSLKSPASAKDVRVRMVGRTAVLVGNVTSQTDERLIARMVLLEPGVDNVASELSYPGKLPQTESAK